MNLLKRGSRVLEAKFEAIASEQIQYVKIDTQEVANLNATPGASVRETTDSEQLSIEHDDETFLIRLETPVTEVPEATNPRTFRQWLNREPLQNDRIRYGGTEFLVTRKFNMGVFRFTDAFRTQYRISVKPIENDVAATE